MSLLDKTFDRTLDAWTHAYMAPAWRGAHLEGWLFEDAQARRAAEARLAQAGVQARFRSAYKPLLHYFLEEVERDGLIAAEIRYPLHEHAQAKRFTLEAYPLVALLDGVRVTLQPGASDLHYDVDLRYADGREIQSRVFAPTSSAMRRTAWPNCRPPAGCACATPPARPASTPPRPPSTNWRSAPPSTRCATCLGRPRTLLRAPGDPRRPARHRLRAAGRRGNRQHLRGAARGPVLLAAGTLPAAFRRPATAACSPADHSRRAPPRRRRARAHLGRSLHAHIGGHARPARLPAGAGARAAIGGADRRLHGGPGRRRHVPGHLAPGPAGAGHLPARPRSRRLHFRRPARQRNLRRGRRAARRRRWPPAARATSR